MQDTEKINYGNYPLLFDGRLMGYDTETQGFDYLYEVLPYFVTTEKLTMLNDWGALGRLLDGNFEIYKKPKEFLQFLYNAFYPIHVQAVRYEPIHDATNVVSLRLVTNYVINWLTEKMELEDMKQDLIICEMYATLRPQTPPPEAEGIYKVSGLDCTEFDKLFGNDIKGKIEIWNCMIDLKMIDVNGNYLMGSSISFIKSFVVIMKKYFKMPNQSDTKLVNVLTLKIFGKLKRIHTSKIEDERQIEGFLNRN